MVRCVLRINGSSELLKSRYFSENNVKAWFYPINPIDQQYVQKVEKAAAMSVTCRRYYQIIFFRLMHKANRSAKCYGRCCKAIVSVGTLCLKVIGSLTVPLNRKDAVQQDFYFCPQKVCLSSMLIWLNVRYPNSVDMQTRALLT